MLHIPTEATPAAIVFKKLLQSGQRRDQHIRFGHDVGSEEIFEDVAAPTETPIVVSTAPTGAPRPVSADSLPTSLREWLLNSLGTERGVMSAWPLAPGLKPSTLGRILRLDPALVSGHSAWWLHKFRTTLFSRRDSSTSTTIAITPATSNISTVSTSVFRLGGEPQYGWNWFPRGNLFGMDAGVIDAFLNFGLCVTVTHMRPPTNSTKTANAPPLEAQISASVVGIYMLLEAAAMGVSPPVFAAMLVFDTDRVAEADAEHALPADATTVEATPKPARHVVGTAVASQVHTFTLSDMLRTYVQLRPEDNTLLLKQQISEATIAIAQKINRLTKSKIVKLNMCADSIVFCPQLTESEDGEEWTLQGFGFRSTDAELITGVPYLVDFDTRLSKRMSGTDYDENCAFVLMLVILLAAVRAEFGGVATLMLRTLLNQDEAGDPLPGQPRETLLTKAFAAASGASTTAIFRDGVLRLFQHSRTERDSLPSVLFDQVASDFARMMTSPVNELGMSTSPQLFAHLLKTLLHTRALTTPESVTREQIVADESNERRYRTLLKKVREERQKRIRKTLRA